MARPPASAPLIAAALAGHEPRLAWIMLLASALGAVAVDSVAGVTFLRAVRPFERPQMATVFSIYRDAASVAPPLFFSVLLGFFPLPAVFIATGGFAISCGLLALKLPKRL